MTAPKTGKAAAGGRVRVTLVRSLAGYPEKQRVVARGLGLRKLNSSVVRPDGPEIRGMINKISHMVKVEVIAK